MEIRLRSCVIRPWSAGDAAALQRHADNRRIWRCLRDAFPHPYTLDDAHAFLRGAATGTPTTTFALASAGEAIGGIGLRIGHDVHRKTAELGYWLGEAFWGRGIMTEAVVEFVRWAFSAFELERVFAEPFANNPASVRVLEKAGFVREGVLRAHVFKDNAVGDSVLFAKLRSKA